MTAEVFRSPTISDLYGGVTLSADTYQDPGAGFQSGNPGLRRPDRWLPADHPADAGGSAGSNDQPLPEQGKSFTWASCMT